MIYEIRVYEHVDGRADAVRERFVGEAAPRFAAHGIELLGVFADRETGMLTYMTRFASEEARKAAWASFGSDPEWKAIKAASEADGPLIAAQRVSIVSPAMTGLPIA